LNALIKDENPFIKKYNDYIKRRKLWFPEINSVWFEKIKNKVSLIKRFGEIYEENFHAYEKEVWSKEKERLEKKAKEINQKLKNLNLIEHWEKITGIDFKVSEYQIVLVSAIKNGPNANSLGYDRNVFYSENDLKWTIDFISHEVGTHIMFDIAKEFMKEMYFETNSNIDEKAQKFQRFYKAYECLAQFYNTMVLKRKLNYDLTIFESNKYISFYHKLYTTGVKSYDKLIKAAMDN
jgi:hypothetical protein